MIRFIPRYKLLLRYNINRESYNTYYQFVTSEFVPSLQSLGLHMFRVYHTAYGEHPMRQVEFLAEDIDTVRQALGSDTWRRLESQLEDFVSDYSKKTVVFRDGFQI